MEASLGSIAVGQLADLVIIDTRHAHLTPCIDALGTLVHNGTGQDVAHVIVGGRLVVENHRSLLVDEAEVIARADEAVHAVWARCKAPLRRFPQAVLEPGT
jgi:5-methylthioadenosine/S-adenosylhomocysteine deaminase